MSETEKTIIKEIYEIIEEPCTEDDERTCGVYGCSECLAYEIYKRVVKKYVSETPKE